MEKYKIIPCMAIEDDKEIVHLTITKLSRALELELIDKNNKELNTIRR